MGYALKQLGRTADETFSSSVDDFRSLDRIGDKRCFVQRQKGGNGGAPNRAGCAGVTNAGADNGAKPSPVPAPNR
jgi:hypothetical protein